MTSFAAVFLSLTAAGGAAADAPVPALVRMASLPIEGAEIVAYDPATNLAFVTSGATVVSVHLGAGDDPAVVRSVDLRRALPDAAEVSHVAVDPAGRGVVAATVIPRLRARRPGRVVFLSTRSGRPLGAVTVGFNPDACAFDAEGRRLVVANEGEPELVGHVVVDPPGSVSIVDLSGVATAADWAALDEERVITLHPSFATPPSGVRLHPRNGASPALDLEPESLAVLGAEAWVTCQENNALLRVDLDRQAITAVEGLGTVDRTVDATADGRIAVEERRLALPMPDQIAAFADGDRVVLLTADEGDARGVVGEDATPLADVRRPAKGRALECAFAAPPAPLTGARSVSVFDGRSLARIADTGDAFERELAARAPAWFNADVRGEDVRVDDRSKARGPEPEGIAVGVVAGRRLAFCSLERPGAIAVLDLDDPARPRLVDLKPAAPDGDLGPEGICFVPPDQSPTGAAWLLVGYEASGTLVVYRVGSTLLR